MVSRRANPGANYANSRCHDFKSVTGEQLVRRLVSNENTAVVESVSEVQADSVTAGRLASCLRDASDRFRLTSSAVTKQERGIHELINDNISILTR